MSLQCDILEVAIILRVNCTRSIRKCMQIINSPNHYTTSTIHKVGWVQWFIMRLNCEASICSSYGGFFLVFSEEKSLQPASFSQCASSKHYLKISQLFRKMLMSSLLFIFRQPIILAGQVTLENRKMDGKLVWYKIDSKKQRANASQ